MCRSTPAVKDMKIPWRNCIRHDETKESMEEHGIKLEVFQNYSRPSCLIECRAREMFKKCGCLPYYFPNFNLAWKINTTSCDYDGYRCITENSGENQKREIYPPPLKKKTIRQIFAQLNHRHPDCAEHGHL